jgi:hypothetical protein
MATAFRTIRMLALGAAGFSVVLAATACAPVRPHYRLDDPPGSSSVDDANDVANGIASNVTFGQPGLQGTSARFNGVNSVIRVPSNPAANPGDGDFSVTAAVNFTALPGASTWDVVRKGVSGDGGYWKVEVFTGDGTARARCLWRDNDGLETSLVRGRSLHDGAWHTVTCAIVGSEHRITVDGNTSVNTPSRPLGAISNSRAMTIGAKPDGTDAFNGRIDEVRLG